MAQTYNAQLKKYNGTDYDIFNPKTVAGLVGVVALGGDGYAASRQFVTGEMLSKLKLSVNSAGAFCTLDGNGQVPANQLANALTELKAVDYGTVSGDLDIGVFKEVSGGYEFSYMKMSALSLSKSQVGLGNVDNTSDANKPVSTAQQKALNHKLNTALKGAANGLAELDENRKIVLSQIPDFVLGQMINGGLFNATTAVATLTDKAKSRLGTSSNTITLTNNTTAITGYPDNENIYYTTNVGGTFAGITFEVGDWLVATASGWGKVDNTDAVSSVNGKTGVVVLTASDVGARASTWVPAYSEITGTKPPSDAEVNPDVMSTAEGTTGTATTKRTVDAAKLKAIILAHSPAGSRPASDVYSWAKAASKPTYTRSEVDANKTFVGTTEPTGAVAGDIWFDTSA